MQLEKVHVTNFRSVDDSQEFSIDPVTCLVGKNEAGKSAILLALAALNPHPSTPAVFEGARLSRKATDPVRGTPRGK